MPKKSKKSKCKPYSAQDAVYAGFGIASFAKDKLDTLASFLMKEGEFLAKDKAKFREKIVKDGEKYYKTMMKDIEKASASVLKKMNIPTRKEFEALKKAVSAQKGKAKKKK